jgi:hypothetical protein
MAGSAFQLVLPIGAAVLAVWIDVRFDSRRPRSPMRRAVYAFAACGVLQLATVIFSHVGAPGAPLAQRFAALFLCLLPCLVFAFLTGFWLMRTLGDVARLARR